MPLSIMSQPLLYSCALAGMESTSNDINAIEKKLGNAKGYLLRPSEFIVSIIRSPLDGEVLRI